MTAAIMTHHAVIRIAQRGLSNGDIEIVRWFGTEVEGGYLLLEKDAQNVERDAKRLIATVRRLRGTRIVVRENDVVTAYHARPKTTRRLLRGAEERELDG